MREILFRGKRIDSDEWVYGGYKVEKIGEYPVAVFIIEHLKSGVFENHRVDPETVGQYTGLTDKNGKKIFEGDIIQTKKTGLKGEKEYRFVIKYGKYLPLEYCREIYSQWQTIGFYAFDGKRDYQLSCFKDLLEVIGNIHENPEILKGETKNER